MRQPRLSDDTEARFTTTHWSVVLAARNYSSPHAEAAMEKLCRAYWPPLYAFVRREGLASEDAQDLTQEFFRRLVWKEWLGQLQHQRGKFRSFLLTFLKHFLSDQRDHAAACKRGGRQPLVSLDQFEGDERERLEPVDRLTADQVHERVWAQALMARAADRLQEEYVADGKADLFNELKDRQISEHGTQTYAEIGARFGLSEQAIKNAVHRLRRRHREILREEIARTVASPAEVEGEIRHLLAVLNG
jgi:RNA polymerase sigma-70 factor (ECF subfamily)